MAWFEDAPDRLQQELAALEAAGIAFVQNETARDQHGIIEIDVTVQVGNVSQRLVATYPDEFPYFKPLVHGPDVGFIHHFNPDTGEYCLLETGHGAWAPSDTLAWLLTEQLEKLVAVNAPRVDLAEARELEAPQAEPFSCYLTPQNPSEHVIVDGALDRNGVKSGWARLQYTSEDPLRGHIIELLDENRNALSGPVRPPTVVGPNLGQVPIPWVQLSEAPRETSPEEWWAAAAALNPNVNSSWVGMPGRPSITVAKALQFVLVGFPEEEAHRHLGQGWAVLVRFREKRNKPWRALRMIRVERAGHLDLFDREPRLRNMADSKILLAGLGGLGGQVANLLACMVPDRLTMIDGDVASAATAVRNVGAFATAGSPKVQVAFNAVHGTQPYTEPRGISHQFGRPRLSHETAEPLDIPALVSEVDLVIDATADLSVQHYLSDTARDQGVGYLRTEALPGVWSGFIGLQRPNADVCWMCWQYHLATTIPPLPERPRDAIQPPGCGAPTYTGAGFDLAAIAAQTARTAASYLTGDGGYGAMPADVMTVQFCDASGKPALPRWDSYLLGRHGDCRNHA